MAAGSSNYWEDLRKQARQLENELDLKLVSFSKLCTSYSSTRDGRRDRYSSDTTPLLNGSSQDRMFETMAVEIEQLLGKLTGINDKMAEYTNSAGVPSLNAALMHTLQRHRDILQDYTHEFHKTKANFLAIRERENLLGSVRKDIESYKSGSGVNNRRTELFLKEHEHLRNSDRLIEETISIAMATKENMTSQRGILKSIQNKMNTLASILSKKFVLPVRKKRLGVVLHFLQCWDFHIQTSGLVSEDTVC
ncbi:Golgi SNAP receptor complex member 1 isoform X1 [Tyto alba]|nr:Golgi SNAP receptor complex member 1 isoform X1 [Tyto alba]